MARRIAIEVAIIVLLVIANGVFAMIEIAVVSARRARLQKRADRGDERAAAALALARSPNEFLSTVQIGITLVGVFAGAFAGATIAEQIGAGLASVPWIGEYGEAVGIAIVVIAITFLSLVLGELVPKRLGLANAEAVAAAAARPMRRLARFARPVVWLCGISTEAVLRLLGPRARAGAEPPVTEEEVRVLIEQGTKHGTFVDAERSMIESVLRLGDRRVAEVMTPRQDLVVLDLRSDGPAEIARKIRTSRQARFPVVRGDLEDVVGIVRSEDLLAASLEGRPVDLAACATKPLYVPESLPALALLDRFQTQRPRVALVVDEYGGIEGIVTMGDVLDAIVGAPAEDGRARERAGARRGEGARAFEGSMPMDEVEDALGIDRDPSPTERAPYRTLGGFIMWRLGRVAEAGDRCDWRGFHFEVAAMDGRRVDRVTVTRHGKAARGEEGAPGA